uniref:C2H2-type domain-containing protein n=1 Tax=Panagrolaimus sp. JU765 TaxID=591449 RepID=A0AC34R1Y6_9BILA
MPKIKKTPIIETPEIVRPSRAAKNKFNERLGLGLHAASPPRETTRPRRKRRAIRRFSSDDLPKLLNPKLDDEGENHSEDDGGYDENSMFEQSKEVSEGEEPMEGVENEQKEAQQPVENVEEEPAGSDNKILVYMDHDLTPVAAHLVHLNDFKEMSDYKTYHSHRFMCDICCTSCSDYQDYVKHVAGHGEIHAICALCQLPETPYSLNA